MRLIALLVLLTACRGTDKAGTDGEIAPDAEIDADGDGWNEDEDCDDGDAAVNPGAVEVCDGADNDCDEDIDEGLEQDWFADADDDGWGDSASVVSACEAPEGAVAEGGDCDDLDPATWPGAPERCDEVDNDCDGDVDEDVVGTWYLDADADGYGDGDSAWETCDPPEGWVSDGTDCDDLAAETWPGAPEVCDEADNSCDGTVDEGVTTTFYVDGDGDGYGDDLNTSEACSQPSGHAARGGDCDDTEALVSPAASERCDEVDNDCDGDVDEDDALDAATWYGDGDGDGYGDEDTVSIACAQPSGAVADDSDCDDTDSAINPAAAEVCDEVDNDCDGLVDDDDPGATGGDTWYRDADADGYGTSDYTVDACEQPAGYVDESTDCDDLDADTNPAATEVCDGSDNDCDGDIDDDDGSLDTSTQDSFYADTDADGYGDASVSTEACEAPSGYVDDATDCDDTDTEVNPEAEDVCDGVDNDCDGTTDPDGVDSDGDGTFNCVDSTVWSDDFSSGSWGSWSEADLGGGNAASWTMGSGYLYERSNAANSVAIGPDLGELSEYTISVEVYWGGTANNGAAIVFDYVDTDNFWMARWLDPNDYYGSYSAGGRLDLYRCEAASCSVLATDGGSTTLSVSTGSWNTLSVSVSGEDLSVALDGTDYVTYTASGEAPIGAGEVGLWTYDNDGGVYYDDFEVTNP